MAPFVLMTILTRFLLPEEYGIWLLFVSISSFVRPVLGLTLQDAVRMRYFTLSKDSLSQFVVSATWISTFLACIALVIVFFTAPSLSNILKFPKHWLWSVILVSYLYGLFCTAQALFQFKEDRVGFTLLQIILTGSTILLVASLAFLDFSWKGPIIGTALSLCIAIVYSMYALRKDLSLNPFSNFSKPVSKELLLFGLRYLPTGLSLVVVPLTDRLFVAHMVGVSETSYLGIGQMFAFTFLLLSSGFHFAWQPKLFNAFTHVDGEKISRAIQGSKLFYSLTPIAAGALLVISFFSASIIVGPSFQEAGKYIIWMFVAVTAQSMFQHNQAYLHCNKQVTLMSFWSLLAIVANPILNYYLIKMYGGIGVAIATILTYGFCAIGTGISAFLIIKKISTQTAAMKEL